MVKVKVKNKNCGKRLKNKMGKIGIFVNLLGEGIDAGV